MKAEPARMDGRKLLLRASVPLALILVILVALFLMNRERTLAKKSAVMNGSTLTFRIYETQGSLFISYQEQSAEGTIGKHERIGSSADFPRAEAKITVDEGAGSATFSVGDKTYFFSQKTKTLSHQSISGSSPTP